MVQSKYFNKEFNLILKLLFEKKQISKKLFKGYNYDKIISISSRHLMIPSLYVNLKKKKYDFYCPSDFVNYCKEIYLINKSRNLSLVNDVKEISQNLNKNQIDHTFIKGSAHLFFNLYHDIGERMIGDIDILVNEKQCYKAFEIIKKIGYEKSKKYNFFENQSRHLKRQIGSKKLFAVEIHKKIIDKNKLVKIDENSFLQKKIKVKSIYIPNTKDMCLNNIYSSQINDRNHFTLNYDLRNIYDTFLILNKIHSINIFQKNKVLDRYFYVCNKLGITDLKFYENNFDFKLEFRLFYKSRNKLLNKLDKIFFLELFLLKERPMQLKEYIYNQEYRKFINNKLIKKFIRNKKL